MPSFDPRRPFSRAEARAAGLRMRELLGPRFHKVLYDQYVDATVPVTPQLQARAALGLSPTGSWASHSTAAQLWGGIVPATDDVHVTVPGTAGRTRRRGVRAHSGPVGTPVTTFRGLPLSPPSRAFVECATLPLTLVDLVVLGDSLVRAGRITEPALREAVADCTLPGARRARRAARHVRTGVDSATESRLRMLLIVAGLPEPVVNLVVRAEDGSWRMRFDLSYPAYRLIVEYDGRQHADDPDQWHRDLARREELDRLGWRLIVVTARDLYSTPETVVSRVRDALAERRPAAAQPGVVAA